MKFVYVVFAYAKDANVSKTLGVFDSACRAIAFRNSLNGKWTYRIQEFEVNNPNYVIEGD